MDTREVRNLTRDLDCPHLFLRVLYLYNGDYLLIGPREYKHPDISRHVESELWLLDKEAAAPPVPLGRRIWEGAAVSTLTPRIAYSVGGRNDPSLGAPDRYECHVTEIEYTPDGPRLGTDRVFYRTRGGTYRSLRTSGTGMARSSWLSTTSAGRSTPMTRDAS